MKIKLVTPYLGEYGGQERVTYELFVKLIENGQEVSVLTQKVNKEILLKFKKFIMKVPYSPQLPQLFNDLIHIVLFSIILKTERNTILHLNGSNAFVKHHVNTCHFCHSAWKSAIKASPNYGKFYHIFYHQFHSLLEKIIFKYFANSIVATSYKVKRELIEFAGINKEKIVVIHNGVDVNVFNPQKKGQARRKIMKEFGLSQNSFILFFAGDMTTKRKGFDIAINLMTLLKSKKNIILLSAGGKVASHFMNTIKKRGLKNIVFTGYLKNIENYFPGVDVFLTPSRQLDHFSLVILEALASGVPVITSKSIGPPQEYLIIDEYNGWNIYDPNNLEPIKDAILKLYNNPSLYKKMSINARKTALKYAWENMAKKYEKLYMEILR